MLIRLPSFWGFVLGNNSTLLISRDLDVPLKKVLLELSDVSKIGLMDLMAFLILHIRFVRISRVRC